MSNSRDDFSEATKRKTALRVGYRCSFKDCNCPTVGASMESKDKSSSIGVAAHICAAAPGGPRYDETMTPEERKDISNCIWMCQTHAHLIDTDEKKYTVDLLKEWKLKAEQDASAALADPNFFNNSYRTNPDNLDSIYQIFKDMLTEGHYRQLYLLLSQYKTGQLSDVFDEFVLRFKIIYDAYCDRVSLNNDISQYVSLPCKYGIDELMELFITLLMKEELKPLIEYCENPDLIRFATIIIEGRAETDLLYSYKDQPNPQIPEKYRILIFKAATNDVALNIKTHIQFEGQEGYKGGLYNQEFYYHVITAMYSIVVRTINKIEISISDDNELLFVLNHIESIKCLDLEIQEIIWTNLLRFLSTDVKLFKKYYSLCPDELIECDSIKKSHIIYLSQHEPQSISLDETVALADRTKDYRLITLVFDSFDKRVVKKYLDDHRYLLSKSCNILFYRIIVVNQLSDDEVKKLLNDGLDTYKEDFLYHCLRAKYFENEKENELSWLENNLSELSLNNVRFYCSVLDQYQQWEQLCKISQLTLPIHILCEIANILAISQIKLYMLRSKEILESAIKIGFDIRGLKHNLGLINLYLGYIEAAKKRWQEEYDEYHSVSTLKQLIALRINSDDFVEDSYLVALSKETDYSSQNLVGATYSKLQNYQNAYKFFIRSLLLNDGQTESITGLCFISQFFPESGDCNTIQENTVCTLSNAQKSVNIAIHSADIIDSIIPNQFAGCEHYSVEDTKTSTLLYRSQGETVCFDGIEYTISNIAFTSEVFFRFAFSEIIKRQDVTKIYGASPEEALEQISTILKNAKEKTDKLIDSYNQSDLRIPISSLSKLFGKSMLVSCEFLAFENKEKIRNNLNHTEVSSNKPVFILSYDSIVFLSHLNVDLSFLDELNLVCSSTVKKHITNDIDDEINTLTSDKSFGSMSYSDGKPQLTEYTPELRRTRHAYLNSLKKLIKQIRVIDTSYDYDPQSETWKEAFSELILGNNLLCESSSLGLAQNTPDSVFVTDDQIIYNIASAENIPNIGLVSLLTFASLKWEELLEISKSLQRLNFINYLPIYLYKKMVDSVIDDTERTSEGSSEIINWLKSDTEGEPSEYHENIVIELFKEVLNNQELQYLNPDGVLGQIALTAFDRQNPGLIAKQINAAMEELKNLPIELLDEETGIE